MSRKFGKIAQIGYVVPRYPPPTRSLFCGQYV
jgi:hypothetical protein